MKARLYTDGGTRKRNPGKASYGWVICKGRHGHIEVATGHGLLGIATNNIAEYVGLIRGLEAALEHGVHSIDVRVDNQMVANQVAGRWECKNLVLQPLLAHVRELVAKFDHFHIKWVPREKNKRADALCRVAIKERWPS